MKHKAKDVHVHRDNVALDRVTFAMVNQTLQIGLDFAAKNVAEAAKSHAPRDMESAAGQVAAAAFVAAAAGPLAVLGSYLSKRNLLLNDARPADEGPSILGGCDPDVMLVAALFVRHAIKITGNADGKVEYDASFQLGKLAAAMRDYHKLTGQDAANFIRADFVELASIGESVGNIDNVAGPFSMRPGTSVPRTGRLDS